MKSEKDTDLKPQLTVEFSKFRDSVENMKVTDYVIYVLLEDEDKTTKRYLALSSRHVKEMIQLLSLDLEDAFTTLEKENLNKNNNHLH
jgi:hypothetical protein